MDGQFVKNTSFEFGLELPRDIRYEAHLMLTHAHGWFMKNKNFVKEVIIHYESDEHIHQFIKLAKKL